MIRNPSRVDVAAGYGGRRNTVEQGERSAKKNARPSLFDSDRATPFRRLTLLFVMSVALNGSSGSRLHEVAQPLHGP